MTDGHQPGGVCRSSRTSGRYRNDRWARDRSPHPSRPLSRARLRPSLAETKAASIKGAVAQIAQIPALAEQLYECVDADPELRRRASDIILTLTLIAYSAAAVMRAAGGVDAEHALLAYFLNPVADPHARLAEVCKSRASATRS